MIERLDPYMLKLILLLASGSLGLAQQYTISTVAGGVPPATPVAAASISIGQPRHVAAAPSGSLYFSSGNCVFKLDGSGVLTLIAGNSRAGFSGDGGPAVTAQLNAPQGVAVDAAGNIYIADSLNNRVRRVSPSGMITTLAGNGATANPGLWGDGGAATNANLHLPTGVAVDSSGNVYIAVASDHAIRRVSPDGNISLFAGTGYPGYAGDSAAATSAQLRAPEDVAIGPSNTIYIADTGNAVIRKVASDGTISTIAGNGAIGFTGDGDLATKASMISPFSVAVDSSGNVYIAELGDSRIRKVDSKGNISTVAGNGKLGFAGDGGPAASAQLNSPTGVAVDSSGNLYIADSLNCRVRKMASGGAISTVAGNGLLSSSGDGGPAVKAQLNTPLGVAVDAAGSQYIADSLNNIVRKVAANGVIAAFAGTGTAGSSGDGGAATSAQLNGPQGVAVDATGNLYIADTQNHRVRKVSGGNITTVAGSGTAGFAGDGASATGAQLNAPFGVAVDASGNLYIAEFSNNRVRKVDSKGNITTAAGNGVAGYSGDSGAAMNAQLNGPQGVAVDAAGNLYIADTGNNRVRLVTSSGAIATVAGNGVAGYSGDGGPATSAQVGNPAGVAVDALGNLYIADGSARVRKVYPGGIIATIAGAGVRGYSGDGGTATNARLSAPSSVAVAAAGNLYVADTGNNAIRLLQFAAGTGVTASAVANGASNLAGPIAPGLVVVIYGSGLGPSQVVPYQLDSNGLVPTNLAGTSVVFNGALAPVIYTSANQVAAVVPYGITGPSAQVFVQYLGQASPPITAPVATAAPALFTLDGSGKGQAAAFNQDGSLNGAAHPAKAGSYVSLIATGAGQTNPPGMDGLPAAAAGAPPLLPVAVTIGGKAAQVQYAGGAPNMVAGVMQVNAQIPAGLPSGNVSVVVQVGSFSTQAGVTIAVTGN